MKKLLFLLIALSSMGKVLVADMDTEGVIGRDIAQDIQTCLDKKWDAGSSIQIYLEWRNADSDKIEFKDQVNQQVEKIKNTYCRDYFNDLNLIYEILLPPISITLRGKPLIERVNKLIATVKEINEYPDGLDWFSGDAISAIDTQTVSFENEMERVYNVINEASENNDAIKKIVVQRGCDFNQKKIAMIKKIQEEQQKVVSLESMNCE